MSNVLVLNWFPKGQEMRQAVYQHQHALDEGPDTVVYHNAVDDAPRWLRALPWDAVILHTVFLCARWVEEFAIFRRRHAWLAALDCVKIAIPQDEYDHAAVLDEWLYDIGVTHVLSCLSPDHRGLLYPRMQGRAKFRDVLTGYINRGAAEAHASRIAPLDERPFDIVYRALRLPLWFGSHGALKHGIAAAVEPRARALGLATDISTDWRDTIFEGWLDFLGSGRTVIGAESGSSVLDRYGEIKAQIAALTAENPTITLDDVDRRLPPGWDSYEFFAISPRHLEAVVTKTCQVLVEGTYSGVLEPGRHYLEVKRDLSNLDDVLDRLCDHDLLSGIAERAYDEIYLPGRYDLERFADGLRELIPRRRARLPVEWVRRADHLAGAVAEAKGDARSQVVQTARRAGSGMRSVDRMTSLSSGRNRATSALRTVRLGRKVAGATLASRARRRLVLDYAIRGAWREIPPVLLARDLLRLAVIDDLPGEASIAIRPSASSDDTGVYWDDSTADGVVPIAWRGHSLGSLATGGEGAAYRFEALSALLPHDPDLVRAAVLPASQSRP